MALIFLIYLFIFLVFRVTYIEKSFENISDLKETCILCGNHFSLQ